MQITVIGAGAIGSAIAHELVARQDVDTVLVCDAHARALQELSRLVKSPRLRSFQVDARDRRSLEPIIAGSDCIIGAMSSELSPAMAALAIKVGSHYCDLGGSDAVVAEQLAMATGAHESDRWIVPGCGLAPGLVNVLCMHGMNQFESVRAAHIRVGDIPLDLNPPFNYHVTWSAEKVLDDYTLPVERVKDGAIERCEPLTEVESIGFGDSYGPLEAFYTAGSLSLLAQELAGRVETLDHKSVRRAGHAHQMQFLLGLGFAERRPVDVQSHLTYRDLLMRRLRQRIGVARRDAVLMRVLLIGMKDGMERSLVYEMAEVQDETSSITAMRKCTAVPAACVAVMLASGSIDGGGASPPEVIVPKDDFRDAIAARGLKISETWIDGAAPISGPAA